MKILIGGDISFGRCLDGEFISYSTSNCLKDLSLIPRDYSIFNLESPFSFKIDPVSLVDEFAPQCAEPISVKHLIQSKVDYVSLANNHALDCGIQGVNDTIRILDRVGIKHSGTAEDFCKPYVDHKRKLVIFSIDCVKKTYTSEDPVNCKLNLKEMFVCVQEMRYESDYLFICCVHWGKEYQGRPNKYQKTLGRGLVRLGIDLVVGCHPHVTQPMEIYKGKPIFYSMGNLYFTHHHPPNDNKTSTHKSYVSLLEFNGRDYIDCSHIPTWIQSGKSVRLIKEKSSNLGLEMLRIARSYLGFGESSLETNTGWFMDLIGSNNRKDSPWCAYFMYFCLKKACDENSIEIPFEKKEFGGMAKQLHDKIFEWGYSPLNPMPGDIITWDRREEFNRQGHIGIIEYVEGDKITVIEGNHPPSPGSKVGRYTYSLKDLMNYKEWDESDKHFQLFEGFARLPNIKGL